MIAAHFRIVRICDGGVFNTESRRHEDTEMFCGFAILLCLLINSEVCKRSPLTLRLSVAIYNPYPMFQSFEKDKEVWLQFREAKRNVSGMRRRKRSFRRADCEATAKPPARARAHFANLGVETRPLRIALRFSRDARCRAADFVVKTKPRCPLFRGGFLHCISDFTIFLATFFALGH